MAYSALAVANAFIERAKQSNIRDLTHMKLQKLVYFAHAWTLAITGKPLLDESVMAWKFGPVIPSLYTEFRKYGSMPINTPATSFDINNGGGWFNVPNVDDPAINDILDEVFNIYGSYNAIFLSNLTHSTGSAWTETRHLHHDGSNMGFVIPNDVIMGCMKSQLGI